MRETPETYHVACDGLLESVQRAANPLTPHGYIPYYGNAQDVAIWWAKYVMGFARRLGRWRDDAEKAALPSPAQVSADVAVPQVPSKDPGGHLVRAVPIGSSGEGDSDESGMTSTRLEGERLRLVAGQKAVR